MPSPAPPAQPIILAAPQQQMPPIPRQKIVHKKSYIKVNMLLKTHNDAYFKIIPN